MADRDNMASGIDETAAMTEDVCRDFLRNVCKRGKACRYRHPENADTSAGMSARKNEYLFCHDFQNKECVRITCRFLHGSREDEEYYRKTGELPPHLSQNFGTGMGAAPTDLTNSGGDVPVCMDFMKGNCKRGLLCKFRHVQREYEYEYQYDPRAMEHMSMAPAISTAVRRYDGYDMYNGMYQADPYEDHNSLLKRRRVEGMHYPGYDYTATPVRSVEHRMLEEEVVTLRRRVEELKKQVSNLAATNEVLLEQNAQFRNQAINTNAAITEQALVPTVCPVTNYNHSIAHGIAQTHTTLSSHAMQPRLVSQHDLMATSGVQTGQANPAGQMNPDITPLSAALAQTIAQGMAPPVSVATVVSMPQPLPPGTSQMTSYPMPSQSMRIPTMPH